MEAWREEFTLLGTRVAELRIEAPRSDEEVAGAEAGRDAAHSARAESEAHRGGLARLVSEQRDHTQSLRGQIAVAEERQRNALSRRERAEQERRDGGSLVERVGDELERGVAHRALLGSEVDTARRALGERTAAEESVRAALSAARVRVDTGERAARELRELAHRHMLDRQAGERHLQELTASRQSLVEEQAQLADSEVSAGRELREAEESLRIARERNESLNAVVASALDAVSAARASDSAARSLLLRSREFQTELESRVNALEALERERVGLAPAAARLLKERERFGNGGVLGPLSDFISADADSASLVERFLGASVHAVLVRDREVADEVRAWHGATSPGPLLLLPADLDTATGASTSDAGSEELAHLVRSDTPATGWVRKLLGSVTAIADGSGFVDARGAIWLPGNATGPGPIRRRAEISESRRELVVAVQLRNEAEQKAESTRNELNAAEQSMNEAQEAAAAAARVVAENDDQFSAAARRHQRALKEVANASALLQRLTDRETTTLESIARISRSMVDSDAELQKLESASSEARQALAETEKRQDEARDARTASEVSSAQAQARLQVATDRERNLRDQFTSASSRLASLQSELSTLSASDGELASQLAAWGLDLEQRQATLHDAELRLAHAELAVRAADERLEAAEHMLTGIRHRAAELTEELHAAELRFIELSGKKTAIRERLETEWKRSLEDLMQTVAALEADDDSLRAEAGSLREQLEALGPVNPLAIEEHEEEQKRVEMLVSQRADLSSAKLSLEQAIREIDNTARDLFLATFVKVRENFRNIFMTLFGGGECDLRLENANSPLDGDIEIHAAPRGKRTQRIHLLSSGERALVALSLLFGIFLTKPSPFCLLDEVDAPLDDANIGRFVHMLNKFKTNTQFIVITHNPRTTTEAADAVYGVTMQEPGVSSLVSVHMRGAAVDDAISGGSPASAEFAAMGA